jgi:hypothetical protein
MESGLGMRLPTLREAAPPRWSGLEDLMVWCPSARPRPYANEAQPPGYLACESRPLC